MKRMVLAGALALAGLGDSLSAQTPAPPEPPAPSTGPAPPRAATRPELISSPEQDYPDAEREAGHHGKVMITGILGTDGRLRDAAVAVSSGAPVLDQISLESAQASLFSPAKDATGTPIEHPISIPFIYARYVSTEPGGGLVRYGCAAFVQDMDWWRATFPDRPWSDHDLYRMIRGVGILGGEELRGRDPAARIRAANEDFARRWDAAREACRVRPEARLADVLQPEGRMIDRLSRAAR